MLRPRHHHLPSPSLVVFPALLVCGCGPAASDSTRPGASPGRVVVYSALDEVFAEPVLADFARESALRVLPKYDFESTKTVGLYQSIAAEARAGHPVCDLFWNNEILNTLRLQREGLLEPFHPPAGQAIPAAFRAGDATWYGFAARARILLVNTDLVSRDRFPTGIHDLHAPAWKGRTGIAKPLFGTTATHAVCLFQTLGSAKARQFFTDLKASGVQVLAGNKRVAEAAGAGTLAFGLTDTDDALLEIAAGSPVAIVYPDQQEGGLGTLFIPNTLALIRGAPHRDEAERLANYLLSPTVESRLARGPSGQIPLNPGVTVPTRVETPRTVRPMAVNFEQAVTRWDEAATFLTQQFGAP